MDLTKPIEEYNLVFLDLETTGLDVVTGDSICEVGALKVYQGKLVDTFSSLVNPQRPMPPEAYRIHKISDEDLATAPILEDIMDDLLAFLQGTVICAYNVTFDVGFINHTLQKQFLSPLPCPAIDILRMARMLLKLPKNNLGAIACYFSIGLPHGLHRAVEDARITYEVFRRLRQILFAQDVHQLQDFISLFGYENDVFRQQHQAKLHLLETALKTQQKVSLRYFSQHNTIQNKIIKPVNITQEKNYWYVWCQNSRQQNYRLSVNRILTITTDSAIQ